MTGCPYGQCQLLPGGAGVCLCKFHLPPMGTFDDDPGGPWRAVGVRCECAAGHNDAGCPHYECPHRLDRRPGWRA